MYGTDIDAASLRAARANVDRNADKVGGRITVLDSTADGPLFPPGIETYLFPSLLSKKEVDMLTDMGGGKTRLYNVQPPLLRLGRRTRRVRGRKGAAAVVGVHRVCGGDGVF